MIILFTIVIRINHNNQNNDQTSQKAGRKSEAKYRQHKRESCWKNRAKAEAPQKHCAKPPPPSPSTKRNPENSRKKPLKSKQKAPHNGQKSPP